MQRLTKHQIRALRKRRIGAGEDGFEGRHGDLATGAADQCATRLSHAVRQAFCNMGRSLPAAGRMPTRRGYASNLCQRLLQIGDEVIDVLDAD